MTPSAGARRVPAGTEAVLALCAGTATFALVAVTLATTESDLVTVLVGAGCISAIVATARFWGIAPAAPVAMAGLLAFDWFQFPPTHPHRFPSAADLAALFAYLGLAVLIGELAAHADRRADVSEVARSALAEEQAALRRVATMVARGVPEEHLFDAVAQEVGQLLGGQAGMTRSGPVRPDDDGGVSSPIVVEGKIWGALFVHPASDHPLPADSESRLLNFTELVATAVANAEARADVRRLADEQAALRRVATLVARESSPGEVFQTVIRELRGLLDLQDVSMVRYDTDASATVVADLGSTGSVLPAGTVLPVGGYNVTSLVHRTERAARIDDYATATGSPGTVLRDNGFCSAVGSPIIVDGRLWGAMMAGSRTARMPGDTERRLGAFTELVATALANADARVALALRVQEQQALRRVATLVAQGASQAELFGAVASEASRIMAGEATMLLRYDSEGSATVVAKCGEIGHVGLRSPSWGDRVTARVLRTGLPARVDSYEGISGAEPALAAGAGAGVGAPIVVEGRPWGLLAAMSPDKPLPSGTEDRLAQFADLVAAAISNAESRSALAASRARIVEAADVERRRVVRDLHDGAQQRLVHTVVTLKLARRALGAHDEGGRLVGEALEQAQRATTELRELAHGILPAVLTHGGLRAGAEALASRMPVPTKVEVSVERLPTAIEATAYFVMAEALTNVAKHARAGNAAVAAEVEDRTLRVRVRDDGVGGARWDGTGLQGLADRIAALDGRLRIESPADGGTLIAAAIPLGGDRGA